MNPLSSRLCIAALVAAVGHSVALSADWPQWRGPLRNGVASESPKLLDALPEGELAPLWDSEAIPSNDDGGLGSVVVAAERVYLSVVWHRDEPSETRQIDELVLRQLGYQPLGALGPELVKKMEETRVSLNPALRGKKLDEFTQQWIAANLDKKQQQLYASYIEKRFRKGALAMPLDVLDKLAGEQQRVFASEAKMRAWLDGQRFAEEVKRQVIEAVPPTRRAAEDTVICLDAATGRTLWKTSAPGEATGRNSSSTPCVSEGRVFALGSVSAYALDAATGRQLWAVPLPQKGPGSSPLVVGHAVIINAKTLFALEVATGRELWKQLKAGGSNSSPVAWSAGGRTLVICNGRNALDALDVATGEVLWSVPGAGDSPPAITGDLLAVQSRKPEVGLVAYRLGVNGAEKLWSTPFDALRNQSSPIVHDDSRLPGR